MTPEQEKRLREMSLDEMSKWTIQRMEASSQLNSINNDPRHKNWASQGGKIQGTKNAESGHMKQIQKLSIGVTKHFSEEVRKKMSEAGKTTLNSERGREIQRMGGSVAGKISQNIERVCEHCGQTITGPLYFRWHGDKCKNKNLEM